MSSRATNGQAIYGPGWRIILLDTVHVLSVLVTVGQRDDRSDRFFRRPCGRVVKGEGRGGALFNALFIPIWAG